MPLTVLTLNVARPTPQRAAELLEYLWHREAQVLVLTEVGTGPGSALLARVCRAAGHAVVGGAPRTEARGGGAGALGVLVVGRDLDLDPDPAAPVVDVGGRVVAVRVRDGSATTRIAGVYGAASDPVRHGSSSQRARKRAWLATFEAWVGQWAATGGPGVLVGDLNIVAPGHRAPLPYVLPEEVAAYERLVAPGREPGLVDAYELAHPGADGVSWVDHTGAGCRYDHALVTPDLADAVAACDLDATPREGGLSDHAALTLRLA